MGVDGLEPSTSPLSEVRSNQLSYTPTYMQNLLAKRFNLGTVIWWRIVEVNLKDDWSSDIEMKFIEY